MGYEIDFLPVGNGSQNGDAILIRWGNLSGSRYEQTLVVVDGGFDENTDQIIDHMDRYYHTDLVDLVVSTHPDADHINGLRDLLRKAKVSRLWMHLPWRHTSSTSIKVQMKRSLDAAYDLEQIATSKGIPIQEPFSGMAFNECSGVLRVAGPSQRYYEELLSDFKDLGGDSRDRHVRASESWYEETLDDKGETTPENNSSVILALQVDDRRLLLTGDAGIPALSRAADALEETGWYQQLDFVQVPHHGSKRNVGPTILDRILGSTAPENQRRGIAFVSCGPDARPKHPHKKVTNAFLRRGYPVCETAGNGIRHSHDAPDRPRWVPITPLPLYSVIEDD